MPEMCLPIRTTGLRSLPALMVLLVGATLGGCSGGDFGRTRADMRNDDMHRWLGAEATGKRRPQAIALPAHRKRTPASRSRLSPDRAAAFAPGLEERVRRLPAAALAMAAEGRIRPHHLWPRLDRRAAPLAHLALSQLIEDVRNDITRFEPFFASAARVVELDRKRNASLKMVSELSPREQADAVARMEENTLIVQWVQQCLERRISSYRWALERLVIQAPDNIAADADRLIGELAAQTANPPLAAQPVIGRAVTVKG